MPEEGLPRPDYLRNTSDASHTRLREMAAASGRPMVFRDWLTNTRRALEAAEYARDQGKHEAFHEHVFHLFYGEGRDIHDWAELEAAAESVGLDPIEMRTEVEAGVYAERVTDSMQQAMVRGINGIPAYVFEDRYLISGAQPYEIFRRVMQELGATPKNDGNEH